MGTHTYIKKFGGGGYLVGLGIIPSIIPFPVTVTAIHMCYTLVSIALNFLLPGNTFPRSGVLRGMLTFLGLFSTKGPFALRLTSFGN